MITFIVDEIIPCLKDTESGEFFDTEVLQLKRKSFLSKFNKRTGWYINWSKFDQETEIYAIRYDEEAKAVNLVWGCTAPQNNL